MPTERDGTQTPQKIGEFGFLPKDGQATSTEYWSRRSDTPRLDNFANSKKAPNLEIRRVIVPLSMTTTTVSDDAFLAVSRGVENGIDAVVAYLDEIEHIIDISVENDPEASEERYTVWARTDVHGDERRALKAELLVWWRNNFAWLDRDVLFVVL